jgi:hypothetical protein
MGTIERGLPSMMNVLYSVATLLTSWCNARRPKPVPPCCRLAEQISFPSCIVHVKFRIWGIGRTSSISQRASIGILAHKKSNTSRIQSSFPPNCTLTPVVQLAETQIDQALRTGCKSKDVHLVFVHRILRLINIMAAPSLDPCA